MHLLTFEYIHGYNGFQYFMVQAQASSLTTMRTLGTLMAKCETTLKGKGNIVPLDDFVQIKKLMDWGEWTLWRVFQGWIWVPDIPASLRTDTRPEKHGFLRATQVIENQELFCLFETYAPEVQIEDRRSFCLFEMYAPEDPNEERRRYLVKARMATLEPVWSWRILPR